MTRSGKIHPIAAPTPITVRRRLLVRDLVLPCAIGIHAHEKDKRQNVRINVELTIAEPEAAHRDRIADVVSYDDVVEGIRRLTSEGHVNLVETLAERIADRCLADNRIGGVRVRVEKLDVVADAQSVGVEIERHYRE